MFRFKFLARTTASRTKCLTAARPSHLHSPLRRDYHSYPDPEDKAQITHAKSEVSKTITDKSGKAYKLDDTFKLDNIFPGVPISTGIKEQDAPITLSTRLDSGLTVATQDMHGLMSSFSFIVRTGSSYEKQQRQQEGTNHGNSSSMTTNTGATQFLELTAFQSSLNRTRQEVRGR